MHLPTPWPASAALSVQLLACGAALCLAACLSIHRAFLRIAALALIALTPQQGAAQAITSGAQAPSDRALFETLRKADSLVFDQGFNRCDYSALEQVMHKDLQFMHDQNGRQTREEFFKSFRDSICSDPAHKPIRKLVEGSLAVYPLKNNGELYGAVQMGIHEFYIAEPGKEPRFTVSGSFLHTWLFEGGQWKLYRVVSYNHQSPVKYGPKFDDGAPFPMFNMDSDIDSLLKKHRIASVGIGYIEHGQLQQIRTFGERQPGKAIANDSLYKVASLTKPVTAMVALKLVELGKWKLDEPVAGYFVDPDIKDSPYLMKLSTRHILNQQSGFPNWRYLTKDKRLAFEYEPGTKFQYSGEGFEYLRKAIEAKFKPATLETLATELLFTPLKMSDTHYRWAPGINEDRYALEHDEAGLPMPMEKHQTINAAANLLTTVGDYSRFLVHVMDGAGLSKSLFADFIQPHSEEKAGIAWGLGMQVLPGVDGEEFALVHTGGDLGTKAIVILLPKSRRGLVIFSNSENGMVLWRKIIEEYLGSAGKEIVRRNLQ